MRHPGPSAAIMRCVTFDPFRTLSIPGTRYLKPEHWLEHVDLLREADWVLFPEYWQVNALHYGLGARIFPSVAAYHLGHDKVEMTRVLSTRWRAFLPETHVVPTTDPETERVLERLGLPLVVKEVRSSEGRGVRRIDDEAAFRSWCAGREVLYAQELLPIDRDLRVVVVGREVVASYWRVGGEGAFLNNLAAGAELAFDPAPPAALRLVRDVARRLRIDHAGFDVAMVGDRPYILEFNRLFGHRGLAEQGIRVDALIREHLERSARPRHDDGRPPGRPRGRPRRAA
ncbi:MAG: hypothetical protein V2J02_02065 [Pseudomonadales bacterium]|jgi:ribosomal protein S6--L-glutamate ligase|nr:hypothetical protein [Pseudomonadales bacterium]